MAFIEKHIANLKRYVKSALVRHEAIVLTYHSVIPDSSSLISIPHHLRESLFREHIHHLSASGYNCISLSHLARNLKSRKLPKKTIAITFDDGFYNNYSIAYPILKERDVPATLFITTELMGSKSLLWPEQLGILLTVIKTPKIRINDKEIPVASAEEKSRAYVLIASSFSTMSAAQIATAINELLAQSEDKTSIHTGPMHEAVRFMDWTQVAELKQSGLVDIGSHTMSHRRLSRLSDEEAEQEIRTSKKIVENHIHECKTFAYPHGRTNVDFNDKHTRMAVEAGYEIVLTADPKTLSSRSTSINLPRISVLDNHTLDTFDYMLRGGAATANGVNVKAVIRGIATGSLH